MKIVLKRSVDISVAGKEYPNVDGEPFEVSEAVCEVLKNAKIPFEVISEAVLEEVPEEVPEEEEIVIPEKKVKKVVKKSRKK